MKIVVHGNQSSHQVNHAGAMISGLKRHGIAAELAPAWQAQKCDVAVIWGYKPPQFVEALKRMGTHVLVMERAYLPDRMEWTSLGWDGLNGRAKFPECQDSGERLNKFWPDLLKPWKNGRGEYILVCGQVPGDASVQGLNVDQWAQSVVDAIHSKPMSGTIARKWDVVYRPHPLVSQRRCSRWPKGARLSTAKTLQEDLVNAKLVITYNSNSGVEAVCAGVPTVALDQGSMAYPVAGHALNEIKIPDRTSWAQRLAWCQWKLEEIASGFAWEMVRTACPQLS